MSALYEDIVKFVANNLKCPICFNIFTKPVTLVCGHNYCQKCINEYWTNKAKRDCPQCRKEIGNSALEINFTLCDILELQEFGGRERWEILAETDHRPQHDGRILTKAESLMTRLDWLKAEVKKAEDKLSAELNSNKDCEMDESNSDATSSCYADSVCSLTSQDHQEKSKKECSQEFMEEVPGYSNSFEDAHLTLSAGAETQETGAEAAVHAKFVDLSFCPELGNRRLIFRSESRTMETQPRPQARAKQGHFDACQWMAEQEFREGWLYWDVVTSHSTGWAVGVAYSNLMRSDKLGRTSSSWCLEWSSGHLSAWHNNIKTSIKHSFPSSLRVILDMTKRQLCFQSLGDDLLELHSFQVNFSGPVRPVFWLYGLSQNALIFPRHQM